MDPTIRPRIPGDGRTVEVVTVARDVSETPPVTALRDGDHPGWASRPARESAAERRYREAFDGCDIDPTDDPVGVVTEAVEAKATVLRAALERTGDVGALAMQCKESPRVSAAPNAT